METLPPAPVEASKNESSQSRPRKQGGKFIKGKFDRLGHAV